MASHIAFEFHRFEFAQSAAMEHSGEIRGVMWEAFFIHFRNLLNFFYGKRQHPTDTLAIDYIEPPSTWTAKTPDWWDEYRVRCNRLLAHLTYERVSFEDEDKMVWKIQDKIPHIRTEWRWFLNALSLECRSWFRWP